MLDQERTASYTFLDQLLRENKDLAFVIHFDREVELLQDFTPSRPSCRRPCKSYPLPQMEDKAVVTAAVAAARGHGGGGGMAGRTQPGPGQARTAAERCSTTRFSWLPTSS